MSYHLIGSGFFRSSTSF